MSGAAAELYDALAPDYRAYAARRAAFIAAVDAVVREHVPASARRMLDVGSGDGVRAMDLARACGIDTVVLSDVSAEMAARCRALGAAEVWQVGAQDLPDQSVPFDVVTCLWNVLGHIPSRALRLAALRRMRTLLAPGGRLFLDVQNRHNAASYGTFRVAGRRLIDFVAPDERRGDATFDWQVGARSIRATGHLFTPAEIDGLLREAGFQVALRVAIDYGTGRRSSDPTRGQLAFVCC